MTVLPQPTALSFDTESGYAGLDHYIITVTGGPSMTVRVRYDLNGYQNLIGEITTDANGQYDSGMLDHYVPTGLYQITGIQNAAAQSSNWVNVSVPYTILPPQPTSFYLDKSLIMSDGTDGAQTYHMLAGNGANIPIDIRYTIDNGPASGNRFLAMAQPRQPNELGWSLRRHQCGSMHDSRSVPIHCCSQQFQHGVVACIATGAADCCWVRRAADFHN